MKVVISHARRLSAPLHTAAVVVWLAGSGAGCERKAPGPMECRSFALSAAGLHSEEELQSRRLRAQVDELTRDCLVSPYDRELLRCFEGTGRLRACRVEFELRHTRAAEQAILP